MASPRYLILLKIRGREEWAPGPVFFTRVDAEICARILRTRFSDVEDYVVLDSHFLLS